MKRILTFVIALTSLCSWATDWYIAKEATAGNTNGLSWANAWTNFDQVKWPSVQAGDTIWISGGPAGGTNTYVGNLSTYNQGANDGTEANPITITTAKDSSHNGRVLQYGVVYIGRNYYKLDGSLATNWIPNTVLDTYRVPTNCNWWIGQTNNDANHGVALAAGIGMKVYWLYVFAANTQAAPPPADVNAFQINGDPGGVSNSEVAYCRFGGAWGFAFTAMNLGSPLQFGRLKAHHLVLEEVHDNYIQSDGQVDYYKNVMRGWIGPTVGHPDAIQGITTHTRIWDNIIQDQPGTVIYVEPIGVTVVDNILIYNNLLLTTTQACHDIFTLTGQNMTGTWQITNVWFFNNTASYSRGETVFTWNSGLNTTLCSATNIHILNNSVVLSNNVTTAVFVLYTNLDFKNDSRGVSYLPVDVELNYNNVHGSILSYAQGAKYGAHGDYYDNGFTNMAELASVYSQFQSNNNLTATFVAPNRFDFRLGADTALKGRGTNLISAITNLAPECGSDIVGVARPTSGAWAIGAYQDDTSLKLWLSANNWFGGTNITDDSGYYNDGILFMASTNWPSATNRFGDPALGFLTGPWTWSGPPAEPAGSIQYFAITNLTGGITNLTNGTVAVWAHYGSNSISTSAILDSGYTDKDLSWQLGRQFWDTTYFSIWTNGVRYSAIAFPDGTESGTRMDTGGWHHYAVTWDGTNFVGYYDGLPFSTNSQAGISSLQVHDQPWIAVGTWKHQGGPALDPRYPGDGTPPDVQPPNCCWFGGEMDDIHIYNRSLSATEVLSVAFGGGAGGSGGGGAPEPPVTNTCSLTFTNTTPVTNTFDTGMLLSLTAEAYNGTNFFTNWNRGGVFESTNRIISFTVDSNTVLEAVYFVSNHPPAVTNTCPFSFTNTTPVTNTFDNGMTLTLTADEINGGNSFTNWNRGGVFESTNRQITVTVESNATLTAVYFASNSPLVSFTISVGSTNPTSGVFVTNTMDRRGVIGLLTPNTLSYYSNTTVTITAPATSETTNNFNAWLTSSSIASLSRIYTFIVVTNRDVTASYAVPSPPQPVTNKSSFKGKGSIKGKGHIQ